MQDPGSRSPESFRRDDLVPVGIACLGAGRLSLELGSERYAVTLAAATRIPPPLTGAIEGITLVEGKLAGAAGGRVEIVVNCGNTPPLLALRLGAAGTEARAWTFAITHAIQDDVLDVIAAAIEVTETAAPGVLTRTA